MADRDTVGALSSALLQKEPDSRDPIELQREMQKKYMDELITCIEDNQSKFEGSFFVVVLTKKERLMPNVYRNYFFARHTCPTPEWDQSVFRYNKKEQSIEYLWTIPAKDICQYLAENALQVVSSERELLQNVLEFYDGTLLSRAKKYNGELPDTIILQ